MRKLTSIIWITLLFSMWISFASYALGWEEGTYKSEDGEVLTITYVGEDGILVNGPEGDDSLFEYDSDDIVFYDLGKNGCYELELHANSIGYSWSKGEETEFIREYYPLNSKTNTTNKAKQSDNSRSTSEAGWKKGKYTSVDDMVLTITEITDEYVLLDLSIDDDTNLEGLPFYFKDSSKKTAEFSEEDDFTWEITFNEGKIYFVEKTDEGDQTAVFISPDVLSGMSEPEMSDYVYDALFGKPKKYDSTKYPSELSSKREKLYSFLEEYKTGKVKKCYIASKSGKLQESIKESEYVYYGELKNNLPEGYGIVCRIYYGETPIFAGEFKKGKPSGYGVVYISEKSKQQDIYEGENCNLTVLITTLQFWASGSGTIYQNGLIPYENDPSILYEGKLKNNEKDGKGKEYDKLNQTLKYEGEFKNDKYAGKGKLYYEDGKTLKYEGEFKNGKYHGKGTLYNKDGSVKHKGKFKNGDIA